MGGAISAFPTAVETARNIKDVHLKQLPDAIEEAIFIHEKFPLIIDPTEQAARLSRFKIIQVDLIFVPLLTNFFVFI